VRPLPVIAIAFLILAAPDIGDAQETPPDERKDKMIREILQLTGSAALSRQVMEQLLPPLKQAIPNVPESFWDEFMAEVDANELANLVVPVYSKHFTLEELEQLVAFYKTPLGKKLINEMPLVLKESMVIGQEWGADIAQRALRKAKARQGGTPS
jgi:uncharacterized protein